MSDRPILFSAPMVRTLLEGRKTQTRRVLKPQAEQNTAGLYVLAGPNGFSQAPAKHIPHSYQLLGLVGFAVGDRLWVRESWRASSAHDDLPPRDIPPGDSVEFTADPERIVTGKTRPSMFMPRWASRLTLTVTEVRVERLQDCSSADAVAEGALHFTEEHTPEFREKFASVHAVSMYSALWDSINGDGAWAANPWVVAVTFTVERANIDAAALAEAKP